jgi:ATP-binding cassette, subfamily C, bacterial CydC
MSSMLRLLSFLGPYKLQVALAVGLGVATIGANVGLLAVSGYLIAAAALKPLLLTLSVPMYLVRFFGVSRAFLRYGERLVSHRMTLTLLARLRPWFYARLLPLVPARLLAYRSGDLLARIGRDIQELENAYLRVCAPALVALLTALATGAILASFRPALAAAVLVCFALAGLGAPLLAARLARGLGARALALRAELSAQLVDSIAGMQDLLAFGQADRQQRRIDALTRELGRIEQRQAMLGGLRAALGDLALGAAIWLVLVLAIPTVVHGALAGVYLAFLVLLVQGSFEAAGPLALAVQQMDRTAAAGDRLFALADAVPAVRDPAHPVPVLREECTEYLSALTFEHVTFAYRPGDSPALQDVSFRLRPGSRVAVVGPSGAGKSTLAHLALRFWDPSCGAIRLGTHAIRDYALDDLRGCFAVVSQDTHIFAGTLRTNLLVARPDASDTELLRAVCAAQLGPLLARLPGCLDGPIGEQGGNLSGGERQRLAIARALLKDAPILILDEATANLDPVTESDLLEAIRTPTRGRSVLRITHRLIGMDEMDEILVLDAGRVVQRGTHAQLRAAPGLYRQLCEAQDQLLTFA